MLTAFSGRSSTMRAPWPTSCKGAEGSGSHSPPIVPIPCHACGHMIVQNFSYQAKSERVRLRQKALSLIIGSFLVWGVLAHAHVMVMFGQSSADAGFNVQV